MSKVFYSIAALESLMKYVVAYRQYFLDIFTDTGIWSESTIREQYVLLSNQRHEEILAAIDARLGDIQVIGASPDNCVKIPWRSKLLVVCFREGDRGREVLSIEIHNR